MTVGWLPFRKVRQRLLNLLEKELLTLLRRVKKKNVYQSFEVKAPLEIDYDNESIADIVEKIEYAIEQHPSFLKVIPQEELEEKERLNRELRDW